MANRWENRLSCTISAYGRAGYSILGEEIVNYFNACGELTIYGSSINQYLNQPTNQPTHQPVNQSVNQSIIIC